MTLVTNKAKRKKTSTLTELSGSANTNWSVCYRTQQKVNMSQSLSCTLKKRHKQTVTRRIH